MIFKVNTKTIFDGLKDLILTTFIMLVIIVGYVFIFDEYPPILLYFGLALFFLVLYFYPTMEIFYSYYDHDRDVEITINADGFSYTKDNKVTEYKVEDIDLINVYLTAYKKNGESARLAHTKFFYVELLTRTGEKIIVTSLLSGNLYEHLVSYYPQVKTKFNITRKLKLQTD